MTEVTTTTEATWQPVTRTSTYELVLGRIEEQIESGALRVGDRLPAERDLAAALGVSRAAVREAVRVLQARGVVRSAPGSGSDAGTIVTALQSDALTGLIRLHVALHTVALADVVRSRVALERESVQLASRGATSAELDELEDLLEQMEDESIDVETFNDLDAAFHIRIAGLSRNRLLADLTEALRTIMKPKMLDSLRAIDTSAGGVHPVLGRLCREHRGIYEAIAAGDGPLAADAVEAHITGFYLPDVAAP